MKRLLCATLVLSLLAGCSGQMPRPMGMTANPMRFGAQRVQEVSEEDQAISMAANLYKESLADDVDDGRPLREVPQQRGGFVYNRLNGMIPWRKVLYPLSDRKIKVEFNKPSKPDAVPDIDAASLHQMQSLLQPGDIILCGNNDSFVHAIVYLGNDEIIHSLAQLTKTGEFMGTIKETLTGYTQRAHRDKFVVLRRPGLTPQDFQRMTTFAHAQVGKSYDSLFLLNTEDRLYCTETAYKTLHQMAAPPRIFPHKAKYGWDLFTVEDIMDSPDLQTVWTYNYTRPPVGRLHKY
ncbi:MAG: hypothetical protein ACAI44_28050 [Candidatus Sericytochromatia bacterium]